MDVNGPWQDDVMSPLDYNKRFLRSFSIDTEASGHVCPVHPDRMTRYVWKDAEEDPRQTWYEPVLAELLPSYRLCPVGQPHALGAARHATTRTVFRKISSDSVRYPRYRFFDPVLKPGPDKMCQRTHHFKQRLFEVLPWLACGSTAHTVGEALICPVPREELRWPEHIKEYIDVITLGDVVLPGGQASLPWARTTAFRLRGCMLQPEPEPPFEVLCTFLERVFAAPQTRCECCRLEISGRCVWCTHARGWHRCQRRCCEEQIAYADPRSYAWAPNSLHHEGQDTEITILSMLRQGLSRVHVQTVLEHLREGAQITAVKHEELMRLVQAHSGGLFDSGPVHPTANGEFIAAKYLGSGSKVTREEAAKSLAAYQLRFQKLWDATTSTYRAFSDFAPVRHVPSQHVALKQLCFRWERGVPILVVIPAPAGYGKSEIIAAWMAYQKTQTTRVDWAILAVTGVAAANAGGTTVHAFFQMRKGKAALIYQDRERAHEFSETAGIIIDEFAMAEAELFLDGIIPICRQIPLAMHLRRRNAIELFGYRDIILFGDLRQLPPASGAQPFWGTATFQQYFEVFCLREDRRHERDAAMRELKELVAWGGAEHGGGLASDKGWEDLWPLHDRVRDSIVDMALRGIGLSGDTVDLEEGTAIFARHNEKDMWNDGYVRHIEREYWDKGLEAVDVPASFLFLTRVLKTIWPFTFCFNNRT